MSTMTRFFRSLPTGVKQWYYNACRWNRHGLMYDDTLRVTPLVQKAIDRLPQEEKDMRAFRIKRALDLSLKHRVLPKDQWTKLENERRYLQPYIEQVEKEMQERQEWNTR